MLWGGKDDDVTSKVMRPNTANVYVMPEMTQNYYVKIL
jgi:hypothetical protein